MWGITMDGDYVKRGTSGQKKEKNQTVRGELEGKGTEEKRREIADHSLVLNGLKLI